MSHHRKMPRRSLGIACKSCSRGTNSLFLSCSDRKGCCLTLSITLFLVVCRPITVPRLSIFFFRPNIEKVYASGWNDSSFFFGTSDSFLTLPFARRDRNELSKALTYPLLDKYSVANNIARHDSEDHNSMNALSFLSNSGFGVSVSEGDIHATNSPHDSDGSVQLGPWSPTHDLPLYLWSTMKHPSCDNLALLTTRGTERAMLLLSTASVLFEDVALA